MNDPRQQPHRVAREAARFLAASLLAGVLCAALHAAEPPGTLPRLDNVQRIVFLGDSITYAGHYVADVEAWCVTRLPDRRFEFLNLGLSSETVSGLSEPGHAGGRFDRPNLHERLGRILAKTKPDLVFACYGMNDGIYHPPSEERQRAFREGMTRLHEQVIASGARIIHVTPPVFDPVPIAAKTTHAAPFNSSRLYAGYNGVLDGFSDWLLAQREAGWDVVDVHGAMNRWLAAQRAADTNFVFAPDGIHPNAAGHWIIARTILQHLGAADLATAESPMAMVAQNPHGADLLSLVGERQRVLRDAWLTETGHTRPGVNPGLPMAEAQARAVALDKQIRQWTQPPATGGPPAFPGTRSQWEGFDRYDFEVNGRPAIVVAPPQALPGKPWIWRGEFFGAYPNADVALVAKGFHLAYLRVPDLFGSPEAVRAWNGFYEELTTRYGFAKKVALIGLSRGGLYCYNWAAANPDKVACIYADAPVCDIKSWPGGRLKGWGKGNGSSSEWLKLLRVYGFKTDAEAAVWRGNPVDNLKPLADAKVPLLHVYGDADTTVPWDENTGVVAERYRQLGGSITVIPKPGVDHHPHGLTNPTPIVEFILSHASHP